MNDPEKTPEQRMEEFQARWANLRAAIAALPPGAQLFVTQYRGYVEFMGRAFGGSALPRMERFVRDVTRLVNQPPPPEKTAGMHTPGKGV